MAPPDQRFWDDVEVGEELTPLEKIATTRTLVMFAGASGDFSPHHYDHELGERWFPGQGIIVHGALKAAWLGHLVTSWAGPQGRLVRLATQDRGMDFPRHMISAAEAGEGATWECRGAVSRKYVEGGDHMVDLEIWVQRRDGEVTTPGSATVILPHRGSSPALPVG
jgi:hypothetical protein